MPIVTVEAIVNWRGSSGKVPGRDRDRQADHGGEHGLGYEQPGHPLDVAQDLSPLGDHPGHDREVVADEHQVGDRARHLGPGPLGDGQTGLLEGGHVVDPVADHRDVATGVGERRHDGSLALGRDPPDRGRGQDGVPQRGGIGGQRLAVERRCRARDARVAGDRAHGGRARRPRAPSGRSLGR